MHIRNNSGFTLIELIVVILIIGILAALALPQYLKSMETSKADDALSSVQMIATTNRMYNLDRGYFTQGQFTDLCGSSACSPASPPGPGPACDQSACGYLARQQWSSKPYNFYSCDSVDANPSGSCCSAGLVACTQRKDRSVDPLGSNSATYKAWGYTVDTTGKVQALGSAPTPQG